MARARKRLPTGISKTPTGYQAQVMLRKHRRSARFPPSATIEDMKDWLDRTRRELRQLVPGGEAERHTLAADVETYLARWRGTGVRPYTVAQRAQLLGHWVSVFGHRSRHSLRTTEIATQLAHWRDHGLPRTAPPTTRRQRAPVTRLAPATVAKVRQALYHLYALLDRGSGARNPVADVEQPTPRQLEPRGQPMAIVDAVFRAMPASRTRDLLLMVAYAGMRPSEVLRVRPEDVTRDGAEVLLLIRTGKRGAISRQPLLPEAAAALGRLFASGFPRAYDAAASRRALQRACRTVSTALRITPPLVLRPYDLRHSFGTAITLATDQRTAQEALRHTHITTTHRYTLAAVPVKVRAALTIIGGREAGKKAATGT